MTHCLDSSALLAHYFDEPGRAQVDALFNDPNAIVGISALSLYETDRRLVTHRASPALRREFSEHYRSVLDAVVPVDETIAAAAIELRDAATARIAAVDILIAATAKIHDAILVHRDAHFEAIPAAHLRQLALPENASA